MQPQIYSIEFDFPIDTVSIRLFADVELEDNGNLVVKNFRPVGSAEPAGLPEVVLKKVDHLWVHRDSLKETDLSRAIGKAIENSLHRTDGTR